MPNPLIEELKKELTRFHHAVEREAVGTILEVGDGVARVAGLSEVMASEMVEFEDGTLGVALNLEESEVGVMVMSEMGELSEGNAGESDGAHSVRAGRCWRHRPRCECARQAD